MITKLATASMRVTYDKLLNLKKYISLIEEAAGQGADLLVLPEQSLQGYLPSMTQFDKAHYRYQYENAETVPDGASVRLIIEKAVEKKIYVVFGMTEKDADFDYKLFNRLSSPGRMAISENTGKSICRLTNIIFTMPEMSFLFLIQKSAGSGC